MSEIVRLHLFPVFTLVALTYGVWVLMGIRRFADIKDGRVNPGYFKLFRKNDNITVPEKTEAVARNYTNLFEMPVLFYAVVVLLILTQKADQISLNLLWIFVAFRILHSLVHVTTNKLILRMRLHFLGGLFLVAVWVRFFIQVL